MSDDKRRQRRELGRIQDVYYQRSIQVQIRNGDILGISKIVETKLSGSGWMVRFLGERSSGE